MVLTGDYCNGLDAVSRISYIKIQARWLIIFGSLFKRVGLLCPRVHYANQLSECRLGKKCNVCGLGFYSYRLTQWLLLHRKAETDHASD
jgi:hypothetical protein